VSHAARVDGRLVTGARVAGRATIERLLASHDTSETYLATDDATGTKLVVRLLWLRGTAAWKKVELFEREAAVLAALDHPDVPRVLWSHTCTQASDGALEIAGGASAEDPTSAGREPPAERAEEVVFALAKTFVEGETLAERIARGPLSTAEVLRIGAQVADVLAYLHGRSPPIVHRDVKPSNVVLRPPHGHAAVIDFGSVADPARFGEGGSTLAGTFGYIAPEQVIGDASPKSDLYALGAMLLACLTGRAPSELPREGLRFAVERIVPDAPLARLLGELVAPDPRDRPRGAVEAATKLRALLAVRTGGAAREWIVATKGLTVESEKGDGLDAAWSTVRERWQDEAAHDRFLRLCATQDQLAFAGHCYRSVLDEAPDDPIAKRGKDRVLAQALALLAAHATPRSDRTTLKKVVRAVVAFVTLVIAILTIVYMVRR
jgi:hypothetical protein